MRRRLLVLSTIALLFAVASSADVVKPRRNVARPRATKTKGLPLGFHRFDRAKFLRDVETARMARLSYTGVKVEPNPDLKTVSMREQEFMSGLLARADIVPPERFQRFRWVQEQQDTKITGWSGKIIDARAIEGGYLVQLRVSPRHAGNAGLMTTDYTVETYAISNAGIRHLHTSAPASRGVVTFN